MIRSFFRLEPQQRMVVISGNGNRIIVTERRRRVLYTTISVVQYYGYVADGVIT